MSWLLDIFLVLLFFLTVILTTDKGFVKSVWSTVTIVGAFVLAYIFGPPLGEWICDLFVLDKVSQYAFGVVENLVTEQSGQYDLSMLFNTLPEEFIQLIENCGADIDQLAEQFKFSVTISQDELYSFAESVAKPLARTVSNAAGVVAVFLASALALWLIGLVVKLIVQLPLIHALNGILGFVLGAVEGLVIVWVLCIALGIFVEQGFMNPGSVEVLRSLTEGSVIFEFFCALSPINFINIQ